MSISFGEGPAFLKSQSMYHRDVCNGSFQDLFYVSQKHINMSDMCFYMRHENIPPEMLLSKLSSKCFRDLGQAIPFIDSPRKTVSTVSTKKYA